MFRTTQKQERLVNHTHSGDKVFQRLTGDPFVIGITMQKSLRKRLAKHEAGNSLIRIQKSEGSIAQSVEQWPFKPLVPGSSPGRPTNPLTGKIPSVRGGVHRGIAN
jgi:hypothetical protein